jgi:hypothetical protein
MAAVRAPAGRNRAGAFLRIIIGRVTAGSASAGCRGRGPALAGRQPRLVPRLAPPAGRRACSQLECWARQQPQPVCTLWQRRLPQLQPAVAAAICAARSTRGGKCSSSALAAAAALACQLRAGQPGPRQPAAGASQEQGSRASAGAARGGGEPVACGGGEGAAGGGACEARCQACPAAARAQGMAWGIAGERERGRAGWVGACRGAARTASGVAPGAC